MARLLQYTNDAIYFLSQVVLQEFMQHHRSTVLLIDAEPEVSGLVSRALETNGASNLRTAASGASGLELAAMLKPDLVILGNSLPDLEPSEVIPKIHALEPNLPVILIAEQGMGGNAIQAAKLSVFDYMIRPLETKTLGSTIHRALDFKRLSEATKLEEDLEGKELPQSFGTDTLVGDCPAMLSVFKSIGKVADKEVDVLIRGEHGTGKEAVAFELHKQSSRANSPFYKLCCRGFKEAELEAELFGIEGEKAGCIELAGDGTLVLQEVADLSLPMQTRLLKAIRNRVYENQQGKEQEVKCRFIIVSSEDLEAKTRSGDFRSDLFYILSSFMINLPPLRLRQGDLPLLVQSCLRKLTSIASSFGVERPRVSEQAMQVLSNHLWPGNIDELESVIKRALVEQEGNILLPIGLIETDIDSVVAVGVQTGSTKYLTDWSLFTKLRIDRGTDTLHAEAMEEAERKLLRRVLRHTQGNQAKASRILGIARASLRKKLRIYGISPKMSVDEATT